MRYRFFSIIVVFFFILPFSLFCEAPAFNDDYFSLTRNELLESCGVNPSLLGFSAGLRISLLSAYDKDNFAKQNALLVGYAGSLLRLDVSDVSGNEFKRFTIAQGLALRPFGLSLGLSYSWYYSDLNSLNDIETLTFSFARAFSSHFLLSFAVRDLVMSRSAGGYVRPEYALGAGFRFFEEALSLHADISFVEKFSLKNATKRVSLAWQPFSGFELGARYQYRKGENFSGGFIRFGFGRLAVSSFNMFKSGELANGYGSISYSSRRKKQLLPGSDRFLLVDLAGTFPEEPVVKQGILQKTRKQTFLELLLAIQRAATDKKIKALYLRVYPHKLSYGRTEELLSALALFKRSGKKIVAYLENGSSRAYTIASIADYLYLQPSQNLHLSGVGSVVTFLKGFLDKIGLKARLFYRGKYKSAAEMLSLDRMSKPHREAEQLLLKRFYDFMIQSIAHFRKGADEKKVRQWFANGLMLASMAYQKGVVDGLKYETEVQRFFYQAGLRGVRSYNYLREQSNDFVWRKKPVVAVVHINGSIVNGVSGPVSPLFGRRVVGADSIVPLLYALRANPNVRAVVVRVQSGGGDLLASDKMWKAVNILRRSKPVIVSMGDVAASGGYYLACGDEKQRSIIHAPRTCVTGSIGVFTGKLIIKGLKDKLGLKTYLLQQGKYAFLYSANKQFSKQEERLMKKSLDAYYTEFVRKVSKGRGLSLAAAERAAQGRVWSGLDALKLGLVDKNCSILDSLGIAAQKAGLSYGKYRVVELPIIRKGIVQSMMKVGSWNLGQLADMANLGTLLLTGRPLAIVPYYAIYW